MGAGAGGTGGPLGGATRPVTAVVLAGGEGTRLWPLTAHVPKPLVPVGRRRCIDYAMASLTRAGVRDIIVTTSYKAESLRAALADVGAGVARVRWSLEREPLGTAGAVKLNEPSLDGTFVVMSADVLADVDLGDLVAFHRSHGGVATMALTTTDNPTEYGIVGLDGHDRIVRFKEKPPPEEVFSDLINAGIYVLEPEALEHVPPATKFDFSKNLFPRLLELGLGLYGRRLEGLWMDIGRPSDLIAANIAVVAREGRPARLDGVEVTGPVIIDPGAQVARGARVEGPAMLADGARVGEGAVVARSFLHAGASLGEGAAAVDSLLLAGAGVGARGRVEATVLDEGVEVGPSARLEDCVLGRGASAGEGAVMSGERLPPPPRR